MAAQGGDVARARQDADGLAQGSAAAQKLGGRADHAGVAEATGVARDSDEVERRQDSTSSRVSGVWASAVASGSVAASGGPRRRARRRRPARRGSERRARAAARSREGKAPLSIRAVASAPTTSTSLRRVRSREDLTAAAG